MYASIARNANLIIFLPSPRKPVRKKVKRNYRLVVSVKVMFLFIKLFLVNF